MMHFKNLDVIEVDFMKRLNLLLISVIIIFIYCLAPACAAELNLGNDHSIDGSSIDDAIPIDGSSIDDAIPIDGSSIDDATY